MNRRTLHRQFKMGLWSVRHEEYREAANHFAQCVETDPNCLSAKINIDLCNYASKFSEKTFQPANRGMGQWAVKLEEIWGPEGDELARRRTYVNNHNEDVRGHNRLAHAVYKLLRKSTCEPQRR